MTLWRFLMFEYLNIQTDPTNAKQKKTAFGYLNTGPTKVEAFSIYPRDMRQVVLVGHLLN